jgi:hypothetical protein
MSPLEKPVTNRRLIEVISTHVERYIGRIDAMLFDIVPGAIALDLFWVKPGRHGDFHTFVTCGMSERAMKAPREWRGCRHAEVLLRLPSNWKLGHRQLNDDRHNWPIRELGCLAGLPHVRSTWLWETHTVANGDPPEPLSPSTSFSGSILLPPTWASPEFYTLRVDPRRSVHFFSAIALYAEELLLARAAGSEVLVELLARAGVTDLVDVDRPNLAAGVN